MESTFHTGSIGSIGLVGWLLLRRWPLPFTSTEDGGCFLHCDQKKVQDSRVYDFHRLNLADVIGMPGAAHCLLDRGCESSFSGWLRVEMRSFPINVCFRSGLCKRLALRGIVFREKVCPDREEGWASER